jgi:RHS repeat-associated protein
MPRKRFIWDPATDAYLMEKDGSGNTTVVYTQEPKPYGGLISQRRNGQTSYYFQDALGSTRQLTDETGDVTDEYVYSAYGETVAASGTTENPFRWIGRLGYYFDQENGAYYVRARTYVPIAGRWLSTDPMLFKDSEQLYDYQRPTQVLDPSGASLLGGSCDADCPQTPVDPVTTLKKPQLYGCYCGGGHPPDVARGLWRPIDPVDSSCQKHDECYIVHKCINPRLIFTGWQFDPRQECIQCDEDLCRALRNATCNRYPSGSTEENNCATYRGAAMQLFKCRERFGIPLPRFPVLRILEVI